MRDLHITFATSAAVELRLALAEDGQDVDVIEMPGDLSFGPISPAGWSERTQWARHALGVDLNDWSDESGATHRAFWFEALTTARRRVAWVSRRSTLEFCNFLEWLRRNGDHAAELVDLTDAPLPGRTRSKHLLPTTALVTAEQFLSGRLWDLAVPVSPAMRTEWLALWQRLQLENSPLRVLTPQGLQSAPMEAFDEPILSFVGAEWKTIAYVVGHFLYASSYETFCRDGVHQTGDLLPISRVTALIKSGRIEAQGDPADIHACQVRQPRA